MGCVFSCLAGTFMVMGEVLENLFLMVGEIASVLIRGVFAVLVGLCDILAAISCCWRVPFSQRPDRETYTFDTVNKNVGGRHGTRSLFSAQARKQRKQEKENAKREKELQKAAEAADKSVDSTTPVIAEKSQETPVTAAEAAAPQSSGWFSFFGSSSKPQDEATPSAAAAPAPAPAVAATTEASPVAAASK